ncbi:hypothetical protein LY76DRAFT_610340 [Colletotrichum caudatum]|nr:hypothetical protein LY76DRAFT_610340 [Colletotrichum caudatum]
MADPQEAVHRALGSVAWRELQEPPGALCSRKTPSQPISGGTASGFAATYPVSSHRLGSDRSQSSPEELLHFGAQFTFGRNGLEPRPLPQVDQFDTHGVGPQQEPRSPFGGCVKDDTLRPRAIRRVRVEHLGLHLGASPRRTGIRRNTGLSSSREAAADRARLIIQLEQHEEPDLGVHRIEWQIVQRRRASHDQARLFERHGSMRWVSRPKDESLGDIMLAKSEKSKRSLSQRQSTLFLCMHCIPYSDNNSVAFMVSWYYRRRAVLLANLISIPQ